MFTAKKSPTTVEGVMAAFNTTINQLNEVATVQYAKAEEQFNIATKASAAAEAATVEAKRAAEIAGKMSAVFN